VLAELDARSRRQRQIVQQSIDRRDPAVAAIFVGDKLTVIVHHDLLLLEHISFSTAKSGL
jgi:hypothetical protein